MTSVAGQTIFLTDGGFATQLAKYVGDQMIDGDPLWSARFNVTNPELVYAVHWDFLQAGADLIRTNTYQASVAGYKKHLQFSDSQCEQSFRETIKLAFKARDDYLKLKQVDKEIRVLASIGPYGAYLSDGSEYNGSYFDNVPLEEIKSFHKERLDLVLKEPVDGLAFETFPSQIEAEIIVDLMNEFYPDKNFWISFNCKNESQTARGENFKGAVESVWNKTQNRENLLAIGVNCLNPKFVESLFGLVNNKSRKDPIPLIAYPNSGEEYDVVQKLWINPPCKKELTELIPAWIELGAKYVGGCCRNDADKIVEIRSFMDMSYGI